MKSNQATIPSVAIVDYGNYVFLRDTATDLINDGYPLHYIFSTDVPSPNYRSDNNSVGLINVSAGGPIQKDSIATRALQERRWGQLCAAALDEINPDSIVVANTPLLSQAVLRSWALSRGRRYSVWSQDLHGLAVTHVLGQKLGVIGRLLAVPFRRLDRTILMGAERVISISDSQHGYLTNAGVATGRILTMPNWASLDAYPVRPKNNPWSERQGLQHTFNFLYSGSLGFKHNLKPIMELASAFKDNPSIRVVIVSEGAAVNRLKIFAADNALTNICILPFQSHNEMPDVLATGDVLLSMLSEDASPYCVPSKILTYCCARRPQLAAIHSDNDSARLITSIGAGLVCSPSYLTDYVNAARLLQSDPILCERLALAARTYAEATFTPANTKQNMLLACGWRRSNTLESEGIRASAVNECSR